MDCGRFLVIYSVKEFGISLLSIVCGTRVIATPDLDIQGLPPGALLLFFGELDSSLAPCAICHTSTEVMNTLRTPRLALALATPSPPLCVSFCSWLVCADRFCLAVLLLNSGFVIRYHLYYGDDIGCAILLSAMLESLIVSACVVEVCGTIVSATSDLHNSVVTCFDSTLLLL